MPNAKNFKVQNRGAINQTKISNILKSDIKNLKIDFSSIFFDIERKVFSYLFYVLYISGSQRWKHGKGYRKKLGGPPNKLFTFWVSVRLLIELKLTYLVVS